MAIPIFDLLFLLTIALLFFAIYRRRRKEREISSLLDARDIAQYEATLDLDGEQLLKKRWKTTFFVHLILSFIVNTCQISESLSSSGRDDKYLLFVLMYTFITIVVAYAAYYCAYKKQGTAMLMTIVILNTCTLFISLIIDFIEVPKQFAEEALLIFSILLAISLVARAIIVCYVINSFQLYKVNKRRKRARLAAFTAKRQAVAANG